MTPSILFCGAALAGATPGPSQLASATPANPSLDQADESLAAEETPQPFGLTGWEVGLSFGAGVGAKRDLETLEANLDASTAALGIEKPPADYHGVPVKGPSWVLALRGGYEIWEHLSAGGELGILLWNRGSSKALCAELLDEWGVEPMGGCKTSDPVQYLRAGPSFQGSFPVAHGVSAQLTVAGGCWMDMSHSRNNGPFGWWMRPTLGAAFSPVEHVAVVLDFGYATMGEFDTYPDPMRGFELLLGVQLLP